MLQKFDERNRNLIININGQLVHRDKAGISPFDSAVQGGDAVWEGLRLYNGRIFKLHEHLDRLERSARALSFAEIPPREKIIEEIKRTLAGNKMSDGVHIRLTLTRGLKITSGMDPRLNQNGPTLIVLAEHKSPVYAKTGLTLTTSKVRRPPPEVLDGRIGCGHQAGQSPNWRWQGWPDDKTPERTLRQTNCDRRRTDCLIARLLGTLRLFILPGFLFERDPPRAFLECFKMFRVLLVVFLVIRLSRIKFHRRQNFGHDRFVELARARKLLL